MKHPLILASRTFKAKLQCYCSKYFSLSYIFLRPYYIHIDMLNIYVYHPPTHTPSYFIMCIPVNHFESFVEFFVERIISHLIKQCLLFLYLFCNKRTYRKCEIVMLFLLLYQYTFPLFLYHLFHYSSMVNLFYSCSHLSV